MDRYGASTREVESDGDFAHVSPHHHGPSARTTHRGLPDICGIDRYASDASTDDHEHEPRNRYHGSAGGVHGDRPRRRGLSPDSLDDSRSDSDTEHGDREIRGQGSRRGAISHHPDPRFDGESSEDEPESEPRATRERRSGPRARRGAEQRRRPDLRFNAEDSEDESDLESCKRHGRGGRRSMAASYADHRGPTHAGNMDDESEYEQYGRLPGRVMQARGGMRPRPRECMRDIRRRLYPHCCGDDSSSEDDLDDSEDEGMRRGHRSALSFDESSRREFY